MVSPEEEEEEGEEEQLSYPSGTCGKSSSTPYALYVSFKDWLLRGSFSSSNPNIIQRGEPCRVRAAEVCGSGGSERSAAITYLTEIG